MGLWGGAIGGIAGFALGGPLGAILGAVLGSAVSSMASAIPASRHGGQHGLQLAFSTALVVLSAKMAKSDGRVTPDEIEAFKQVFGGLFSASKDDMNLAGSIFNEARASASGYEPYARQIAGMVPPQVLEELLLGLLFIAHADGRLHPGEVNYLHNVARIFGFSDAQFDRILNRGNRSSSRTSEPNPYEVLGVSRKVSNARIKTAYRKLAQEHHPDRLVSQGLPEEMLAQANDKMALINRAYDRICKERGI